MQPEPIDIPSGPTRRAFLKTVGAGAAAFAARGALAGEPPTAAGWFDRPMRWAQLTLTEDDPGKFDPDFWLEEFRRTHSDALCLSAGGIVAYYPTRVPFHHRSDSLGSSDPFGYLLEGCRKLGMVVIARTDSHAARQDIRDGHPDWIAVDAAGEKRRHWSMPELWVTCALGPYSFEFMTEVHREIMSLYRVDGIFTNRWAGSGMCYCEHCQRGFRAAAGLDLPRSADPRDARRRSHAEWRQSRLFELWSLWDGEIRKINPAARFIPNAGGGATSALDMKRVGELADILFADRQGRSGLAPPWTCGKNGKEYRATLGRKPIAVIFSVGLEERYRWKDSVQSEAEVRLWVADGVANGLRPWFTKFSGSIHDRRWVKTVEEIYARLWRMEPYLRNEESLARVAVVYSQKTAALLGDEREAQKVEDHLLGMYQALVEARIPFEMVHDGLLDPDRLARFKVLVLPGIACLSDGECAQIAEYARRGGSVVATFQTSLHDQRGARRPDLGLSDLFGVRFKGRVEGPMQNSYLHLEGEAGKRHPILAGLDDAERIINGAFRLDIEPTSALEHRPLTLVPPYPDLPMEQVYPRVPRTDIPEVILRERGASRVAYFPWDIDRIFWEVLCPDHGILLRNAVDWAAGEERPVTVSGPGVLDIAIWRQKGSLTVHLVNLTNPMMMKGPLRELIPVGPQKVKIRLPEGLKARKVKLLVAGTEQSVRESPGAVELTVPSVLDHEVVAVDV